ncbi:acyl-CoA dehydrogenase [Gordonia sp. TBRC 11910]|uniref:3-methylmercaptopropionyl-CoA dehydrogenase n=1 Tax=Gordonia asplenii TaxID=2725283 RepID=A0A848KX95_9ACTN|nr:acyl-CoA dehydrogenase [Gordonia asplenii]NMO03260.1 acyl-CoA dehydrogenase [Gordonia asplenii]
MYRVPTDDYAFLLSEYFERDVVAHATDGDLTAGDAVAVIAAAGEFAVEVLHPLNAVGDRVGAALSDGVVTSPPGYVDAYRRYAEGGWAGTFLPKDIGGEGVPWTVHGALSELWSASNAALSLCAGLSIAAALALNAAADDEIRDTYLAPIVAGRWTATMNLTEPQAGTDLASITTVARPQADGTWAVTGQKIFITWGDHDLAENIVHLVLARTPDAPAGLAGLSLFVVPKYLPDDGVPGSRNSITTVSIEHKLGIHSSPTCVLQYDAAVGRLVGELNGGLAAMFVMMNASRIGIGVQALGVADRAFQQARDYAAQRVQGTVVGRAPGTPIAQHPDVARLLISMSSRISAFRALSMQLAVWLDAAQQDDSTQARELAEFLVPIFKGWVTEEAVAITSDAVQVHGGVGFIEETGTAQHYRDARIFPIYEGTTAIQSNDLVGRKMLRDRGRTAEQFFALIEKDVVELRASSDAVAARTVERLDRALAAARRATTALVEHAASNPRNVFAVSVPYLTLCGLLAGGWAHARLLAAQLRRADTDDRRVIEADFYGVHQLSRVHGLLEIIEAGEVAVGEKLA